MITVFTSEKTIPNKNRGIFAYLIVNEYGIKVFEDIKTIETNSKYTVQELLINNIINKIFSIYGFDIDIKKELTIYVEKFRATGDYNNCFVKEYKNNTNEWFIYCNNLLQKEMEKCILQYKKIS